MNNKTRLGLAHAPVMVRSTQPMTLRPYTSGISRSWNGRAGGRRSRGSSAPMRMIAEIATRSAAFIASRPPIPCPTATVVGPSRSIAATTSSVYVSNERLLGSAVCDQ